MTGMDKWAYGQTVWSKSTEVILTNNPQFVGQGERLCSLCGVAPAVVHWCDGYYESDDYPTTYPEGELWMCKADAVEALKEWLETGAIFGAIDLAKFEKDKS